MIDFTLGICCLSRDFPADWVASDACAVVFQLCPSVQVQQRKSAIHGLPVTLRILRVKSDKPDWFWSQSIVFTNEDLLGRFSHPLSLKFPGQLSLIPKITDTVTPQNYLSLEFDHW